MSLNLVDKYITQLAFYITNWELKEQIFATLDIWEIWIFEYYWYLYI